MERLPMRENLLDIEIIKKYELPKDIDEEKKSESNQIIELPQAPGRTNPLLKKRNFALKMLKINNMQKNENDQSSPGSGQENSPDKKLEFQKPVQIKGVTYTINGKCGKGAFGKVYIATSKNDEKFAIKIQNIKELERKETSILQDTQTDSPKLNAETNVSIENSLSDEFIIQSKLRLKPISIEIKDDSSYMVMPLGERPPEVLTLDHFLDALEDLGSLHEAEYAHNDIKKGNFVMYEKKLSIIDTGISRNFTKTPKMPTYGASADLIYPGSAVQKDLLCLIKVFVPENKKEDTTDHNPTHKLLLGLREKIIAKEITDTKGALNYIKINDESLKKQANSMKELD